MDSYRLGHPQKEPGTHSAEAFSAFQSAEALMKRGARSASAYVTHGVLSGGAVSRIASSPIEMMTITDSILATDAVCKAPNIRELTIAPLLADAMQRISDETSVSSLFD